MKLSRLSGHMACERTERPGDKQEPHGSDLVTACSLRIPDIVQMRVRLRNSCTDRPDTGVTRRLAGNDNTTISVRRVQKILTQASPGLRQK